MTAQDAHNKRLIGPLMVMAALGFASGLPLLLTGFTLKQWMATANVDVRAIGVATLVGLPYSLKFIWAPALDHVRLGWLKNRFGRWRGWLLLTQPALAAACAALASGDPAEAPALMMGLALLVAFLSANQDIAIDAWRISYFPKEKQGIALTHYVWGYRIAMLAAGTGVITLAGKTGWHAAYLTAAAGMLAGIIPTLLAPRSAEPMQDVASDARFSWGKRFSAAISEPLKHFFSTAELRWALAFTTLFNLSDGLASALTPKFYRDLGFKSATIGYAVGFPNLIAALAGLAVGGWLVMRYGAKRTLIATGVAQVIPMTLYFVLAAAGPNVTLLYIKIMAAGFTGAMASTAFLSYLSQLCSSTSVATEYAFLTSLATLVSRIVDGPSGAIQKAIGWTGFYGLSIFASLPALLIMLHILRQYPSHTVATSDESVIS